MSTKSVLAFTCLAIASIVGCSSSDDVAEEEVVEQTSEAEGALRSCWVKLHDCSADDSSCLGTMGCSFDRVRSACNSMYTRHCGGSAPW